VDQDEQGREDGAMLYETPQITIRELFQSLLFKHKEDARVYEDG
jgi:hypothetical protein